MHYDLLLFYAMILLLKTEKITFLLAFSIYCCMYVDLYSCTVHLNNLSDRCYISQKDKEREQERGMFYLMWWSVGKIIWSVVLEWNISMEHW